MKRSLVAFALLCAVSALSWAGGAATRCMEVAASTYRKVKDWVLDGFKLAAAKIEDIKSPVWFVQAKAFMLRLAKRERPEVTGSWRMCPST